MKQHNPMPALTLLLIGLASSSLAETANPDRVESTPSATQTDAGQPMEELLVYGQQETVTEVQTRKLLKVAGAGNDPMRAIGSLPGVTFATGDNGAAPAVRGSSPYENLYLVDFLPVGYVFHGDSSSIISDNTLRDFRLESAAFGPQYNNAMAAVIDVTSRDPYDTHQLVLDASLLRAGVYAESGDQDSGGFFSARESLFQYYLKEVLKDEDFELTTVPEFYDYQGKYQWRWQQDTVSVQVIGARDKAGIRFDDDADEVLQDPELAGGIEFYQQFHSQGLVWDHWYDSGMTQRIGVYRLHQDFRFHIGRNNRADIEFIDSGVRSEFSRALTPDHTLLWGLHWVWRDAIAAGQLTIPPCDEFQPDCRFSDGDERVDLDEVISFQNWDVFVADEWQVSERLLLSPGVLFAWDDYTGQRFAEPKLRADWQVSDRWRTALGLGHYHKMSEEFFYYTRSMGNPDLDQPEAQHYELEFERLFDDGISARLELYYKAMDSLIVARPDQSEYPELSEDDYLALPRFTNDAEGHAWGAELFLNKNLTRNWYGWVSVAYARTYRRNNLSGESFRYEYDQPLIINLVASWQRRDWEIGLKGRLQSGQLYTPVTGAHYNQEVGAYDPLYGDLNSERLPLQYTLDLRAERQLNGLAVPVDLYIEGINLLGAGNVQGYEYSGDYSERSEVKGLPTLVSFGVKIHLL